MRLPTGCGQLAELAAIRRVDVDLLALGVAENIEHDAHEHAGDGMDRLVPVKTFPHQGSGGSALPLETA